MSPADQPTTVADAPELRRLADEAEQQRAANEVTWRAAEEGSAAKQAAYVRLVDHADQRDALLGLADDLEWDEDELEWTWAPDHDAEGWAR